MFAEAARAESVRGMGRVGKLPTNQRLNAENFPALRTKIRYVAPPPELPAPLAADNMDAALFVSAWDLGGCAVSDLAAAAELLPLGFDVYAIGLQSCGSVPDTVDACLKHLSSEGASFVEFSHLISGHAGAKGSLALAVFAQQRLVDEDALRMSCVGMVRDRKLSLMPMLRRDMSKSSLAHVDERAFRGDVDRTSAKRDKHGARKQRQATMNAGAGLGPEGGAVTMRFDFYDTNLLFVNVRESCVGELNEILARVEPETAAHVFMFGDFGADVLESDDELLQRLYLESFDPMPPRFRHQRRMVLTRAQDDAVRPFLVPRVHGHYDLLSAQQATAALARGATVPPPAPFSTYRIHGGAGIDRAQMPGPPRYSLAPSTVYSQWRDAASSLASDGGAAVLWDELSLASEDMPPVYRDSMASTASQRPGQRMRLEDLARAAKARDTFEELNDAKDRRKSSGASAGNALSHRLSRRLSRAAKTLATKDGKSGSSASAPSSSGAEPEMEQPSGGTMLRKAIQSLRFGLAPVSPASPVHALADSAAAKDKDDALQEALRERQADIARRAEARDRDRAAAESSGAPLHTCSGCSKSILLPGDCFSFQERKFHRDCVRCDDCGERMAGQFFVVGNKMLCQASYAKLHVQTCAGCRKPADARDALIQASGDRTYHVDCFRCAECDVQLARVEGKDGLHADDFVMSADGRLLCATHGSKHTCSGCKKPAAARDAVTVDVKQDGSAPEVFHRDCFCCADCKRPIAECGGIFVSYGGDVLCHPDYEKRSKK